MFISNFSQFQHYSRSIRNVLVLFERNVCHRFKKKKEIRKLFSHLKYPMTVKSWTGSGHAYCTSTIFGSVLRYFEFSMWNGRECLWAKIRWKILTRILFHWTMYKMSWRPVRNQRCSGKAFSPIPDVLNLKNDFFLKLLQHLPFMLTGISELSHTSMYLVRSSDRRRSSYFFQYLHSRSRKLAESNFDNL